MCGVVALFNYPQAHTVIEQMNNSIIHRGPDGEGYWKDEAVALGHRRLSIIDLEHGAQPMTSNNGEWVVVFNGEIYNYQALKATVYADYAYQTASDTEIILAGLSIEGDASFRRFNGMFAIVAYHIPSQTVRFARDSKGIKPLYFVHQQNQLMISSEVAGLLHAGIKPAVSEDGLYDFLSLRYVVPPQTLFAGINKTIPGFVYQYDCQTSTLSQSEFRFTAPSIDRSLSYQSALNRVTESFFNAVDRHMVADVPVGMLLSGGVDSAAVAKAAVERNGSFQTFCIGYSEASNANEFAEAEETAELLGTDHVNLTLSQEDAITALPKLIKHLEEPVVTTSTFSYFLLCEAVSKHKKVVLTGQGADEPWAGYQRHRVAELLPWVKHAIRYLPSGIKTKLNTKDHWARLLTVVDAHDERDALKAFHCVFPGGGERNMLKDNSQLTDLTAAQNIRLQPYLDALPHNGSFTERMLAFDTRTSLCENLLLLGDKLSMASSIEVRVPFLDNEYMAEVESLPFHFKRKGWLKSTGKHMHKAMCEAILPSKIVHRPKKGFQTPIAQWLQGHLKDHVRALVMAPDSFTSQFLQSDAVHSLLNAHQADNNLERQIFAIWALEEWFKQYQ